MKHWRSILLWGGLLAALIVANRGIGQHERTLADGRVLLLALEPIDPRAMLQASGMAANARHAQVEHAGHAPFLTHADAVARHLLDFLDGVEGIPA